jgi:hypothetical protein
VAEQAVVTPFVEEAVLLRVQQLQLLYLQRLLIRERLALVLGRLVMQVAVHQVLPQALVFALVVVLGRLV